MEVLIVTEILLELEKNNVVEESSRGGGQRFEGSLVPTLIPNLTRLIVIPTLRTCLP